MAALTTDRITEMQSISVNPYPVAASTKIYAGAMVAIDGGGFAFPAADATGSPKVIGIAIAQADNSAGIAGAINVNVVAPIIARLDCVKTTRIYPGVKLYIVDDHTVGDGTGTNSVKAGFCWIKVSDTDVWVFIDQAYTLS